MADLRKLFRRSSTATTSSKSSVSSSLVALGERRGHSKSSLLLSKARKSSNPGPVHEDAPPFMPEAPEIPPIPSDLPQTPETTTDASTLTPRKTSNPILTVEEATPDLTPAVPAQDPVADPPLVSDAPTTTASTRPIELSRRQSLTHNTQSRFLHTLLESDGPQAEGGSSEYFSNGPLTVSANMLHRKIWVKRPGQSATMVTISEDDLVDDARDMVLKKYANSLGRNFDSPDVTLRIIPRDSAHRHSKGERTLGPEEHLARTLDSYFPGGQSVDEALLIDVPQRRTPRHSPRVQMPYFMGDDTRPSESGADYFSVAPTQPQHSPRLPTNAAGVGSHGSAHPPLTHAMTIVGTGQVPALPSPSQLGSRHASSNSTRSQRPRYPRQHTSSPTVVSMSKSSTHGKSPYSIEKMSCLFPC